LAEHLIAQYPQHVNAHGGRYVKPLVAALAGGHFGIVQLLVRNGAGATLNVRGYEERTPLHSAAFDGLVEVVRFLLEHNADVNSRDFQGQTPLHSSPRGSDSNKQINVIRLLLQHGADVNARGGYGQTPLYEAVVNGTLEVARVLLEHGASVIERDNEGRTPFQVALDYGRHELVKLLSEHGARRS